MIDQRELIRLAQIGDKEASEQLIRENTGLIWSVAKRFIGRGAETDDLYQLGCLGFLKAVEGFDLEYGTQFSTYAVPKISGEIRRFLRDDGAVKVSRSIKEQAATIKTSRSQLTAKLGREPTLTELDGGSLATGAVDTGIIEKDIINRTGTVLPETGGMGTFLLILGSSILVIVAAVFMITRKKMSVYED